MGRNYTIDINFKRLAVDSFKEQEHPRGQPENKGEFVKKGQGTTGANNAENRSETKRSETRSAGTAINRRGNGGVHTEVKTKPYERRSSSNAGRNVVFSPTGATREKYAKQGVTPVDFTETKDVTAFVNSIKKASTANKSGAAVHVYEESEYQHMRLFLTSDGTAGFALKGDDIVSLFKHPGSPHKRVSSAVLDLAVQEGGKKLDCFDTVLPEFYSRNHFRAVARVPFNDEYAPENWDYNGMNKFNNGRPDVVFMIHDLNAPMYKAGDGQKVEDYDAAVAIQTAAVKPTAKKQSKAERIKQLLHHE